LKADGRFIFTFHHWNPKAWAALTYALRQANFVLLNHYIVHAENPISVHINNMKALVHDAILVLAPRGVRYSVAGERLSVIGGRSVVREGSAGPPPPVDQTDSEAFCRDCATHLGWLLDQSGLTRADIQTHWREALRDSE
jgi:putative DNA methylase